MNYQKIYLELMRTRQALARRKKNDGSLESHHIEPKCLGGSNSSENRVLLTPREHWGNLEFRTLVSNSRAKCVYGKRGPRTEETKQKIREKLTGVSFSCEHRMNISQALSGRAPLAAIAARTGSHQTTETKQKIGSANRGKKRTEKQKASMRGRVFSEAHLQALSRARKGVPWTSARYAALERSKEAALEHSKENV